MTKLQPTQLDLVEYLGGEARPKKPSRKRQSTLRQCIADLQHRVEILETIIGKECAVQPERAAAHESTDIKERVGQ